MGLQRQPLMGLQRQPLMGLQRQPLMGLQLATNDYASDALHTVLHYSSKDKAQRQT